MPPRRRQPAPDPDPTPPPSQGSPSAPDEPIFISQITHRPIPRPSDSWLRTPAWMDGGFDPPRCYFSVAEMDEAAALWRPIRGIQPTPPPQLSSNNDLNLNTPSSSSTSTPSVPPSSVSSGSITQAIDTPSQRAYQLDCAMARISPTPTTLTTLSAQELGSISLEGQGTGGEPVVEDNDDDEGYIVRIIILYPVPQGPGAKGTKKKHPVVKIITLNLKRVTRCEVINAALAAHGLGSAFQAGDPGPLWKMYWAGSPGGKSGAATINTDAEFGNGIRALLAKKTKPAEVCIEFSAPDLEPFRIQDAAAQALVNSGGGDGDDQELQFGTHIPSVSSFTPDERLNGEFICKLKGKWKCEDHHGEHGQPGYCYVTPSSKHIRLNNSRLDLWAAAWRAGQCSLNEPPNVTAFDGAYAAGPSVKPRGMTGPRPAPSDMPNMNSSESLATLMLGMLLPNLSANLPLATPNTQNLKRPRSQSNSPVTHRTRRAQFQTPPRFPSVSQFPSPLWPIPTTASGNDIIACLAAFAAEGTDFTEYAEALAAVDLTPQLIPDAPNDLLADLLGGPSVATIGKLLALKQYCRRWEVRHGKQRADVFGDV